MESPVEHTKLDMVLLLDELEYPEAERSEDEHCCYPNIAATLSLCNGLPLQIS
jgi:hypothetical protein